MNPLPPEPPLWLYGVAVLVMLATWLALVVVIERAKLRNKTGRKDGQTNPGEKDMADTKIGATLHDGVNAAQGFNFEFPTEGAARNALAWLSRWAEGDTVPPLSPRVRRAFRDAPNPRLADAERAARDAALPETRADKVEDARCAESMPKFGQRIEQLEQRLEEIRSLTQARLQNIERRVRELNGAAEAERAARDAESPAEAEAAETESLAHQIDTLRADLRALSDRVTDAEQRASTACAGAHSALDQIGELRRAFDARFAELEKWRSNMVDTTKGALDELHENVRSLQNATALAHRRCRTTEEEVKAIKGREAQIEMMLKPYG